MAFVVVELRAGDDFADDGGLGGVVAEDGDFELAGLGAGAADALLDDELAVEAGGEIHRGGEFAAVVDFADADGGAEIRGFYEEGVGELLFDALDAALGVGLPLAAEEGDVRRLGQAGGGEELLHCVLVHAGGGAEDAGADVGDVGEFEEALDGAVFAEGAVEDGEDDVEGLGEGAVLLREGGASLSQIGACVECDGFGGGAFLQCWRGFCVACQQALRISGGEPLALLGDADGDDFVLCAVDGFEDGGGGEEGDFMLAGAAAEEDADAEFAG